MKHSEWVERETLGTDEIVRCDDHWASAVPAWNWWGSMGTFAAFAALAALAAFATLAAGECIRWAAVTGAATAATVVVPGILRCQFADCPDESACRLRELRVLRACSGRCRLNLWRGLGDG